MPPEMASAGSGAKAWAERVMRSAGRQASEAETRPEADTGPAAVLPAPVERKPGPAEVARKPEQAPAGEPQGEGSRAGGEQAAAGQVDRRQLAQRVYRLMRREMIMERERTARSGG